MGKTARNEEFGVESSGLFKKKRNAEPALYVYALLDQLCSLRTYDFGYKAGVVAEC
jgi:hypothetical protein